MSNLQPAVTLLDKGLDLQSPKIIAPAGSVLDSLNYEQVDFQGQKRIDGYARYDGSLLPAFDEYLVVRVASLPDTQANQVVYLNDEIWGILLKHVSAQEFHMAVINKKLDPTVDDTVKIGAASSALTSTVGGSLSGITPEQHYTNLVDYQDIVRQAKQELPGPIAGLHWFRDRLYAIADTVGILVTGTLGSLSPNQNVTINGVTYNVLAAAGNTITLSGEGGGLAVGDAVTGPSGSLGTISAFVSSTADTVASFYESRSEQQAIAEDGALGKWGWRFVHLGWRLMFDNGISPYGDLAALNQNRQGVGVQGPTSTTGDSGRPLALVQKVNITNAPTQVNGWKSTQSRTSYAISASDVAGIDSLATYADAYISWSAAGDVLAPGYDMQDLQEYSATATVVVEIE